MFEYLTSPKLKDQSPKTKPPTEQITLIILFSLFQTASRDNLDIFQAKIFPGGCKAPTFSWRTNWYVGVYGKVSDSVSVWHSDSACRRPLHRVKRLQQCVWREADCQPILKFHYTPGHIDTHTHTQLWLWSERAEFYASDLSNLGFLLHMRKKVSLHLHVFLHTTRRCDGAADTSFILIPTCSC